MVSWKDKYPQELVAMINEVDEMIQPKLDEITEQELYNQRRVLELYRKYHVAEEDLVGSTGYGYDDVGREKLEKIYADYFKTEDALVRPQIVSGTHSIKIAMFGVLRPGDTLYYMTGMPYDTIQEVIGVAGDNVGTFKEYNIGFDYTPLLANGKVDYEKAKAYLTAHPNIKMIALQRSRGYETRDSFTVAEIKEMIDFIRQYAKDAVIFVDNCYGEFSETEEPTFYGADLMVGSMFKNAGAGIAKGGAFIVGRKDLIARCAAHLYAPSCGKEEGPTYAYMRDFYQGFFMAAHTTGQAIKGSIYAAALLEKLGMKVSPKWDAKRTDLVQTIEFGAREPMIKFCAAIQHNSPLNAFVDPVPSYMEGYEDEIIMASGSFIEGSTIELSSDGPLREPYSLYIQGGMSYEHVKVAITEAAYETFYKK
ncbi:Cystathionine beta-lyase family protein involved in aluminum resistance [Ligilactobacillus sp. WC1T17]|uniref:Cystathionine beta-lyase family protein involved in aluminum resistance n=1 Tax=Ligilactobacillus ruminis TaxID=1623 RepID=A0ABY1ABN9_9LACO|nr:Cystathionine beta-lyase family protein involved in aluminum resistance [Ligilactobacillus ruminis]